MRTKQTTSLFDFALLRRIRELKNDCQTNSMLEASLRSQMPEVDSTNQVIAERFAFQPFVRAIEFCRRVSSENIDLNNPNEHVKADVQRFQRDFWESLYGPGSRGSDSSLTPSVTSRRQSNPAAASSSSES
jgi:hypothetical protein